MIAEIATSDVFRISYTNQFFDGIKTERSASPARAGEASYENRRHSRVGVKAVVMAWTVNAV